MVLLAADCGPDDDEAPPPAPCDVLGGCGGVDRDRPVVGGGSSGDVVIVDDGRQAPAVRGVYLDDLDGVLASATRTDELLRWLSAHRFDRVDCYDLGTVLSSSTLTARFATFIGRLRRETAVVHVSAVIGSTRVLDAVRAYQTGHDDDGAGFDGLTLEHEWWNGAGTFRAHERLLDAMQAVADASGLAVDDYVGWFQRPGDAHCARERSELAQCPVPTDDSLAIHTRLLRRFLAEAGARRRARRRAQKKTQATGDVACVSFCHGPSAQPPRTCSAP